MKPVGLLAWLTANIVFQVENSVNMQYRFPPLYFDKQIVREK